MSQREQAKNRLRKVLQSGRILGVQLNPTRGHNTTAWGLPLNTSWFGIPDGNKKYVVEPVTVDTDAFLKMQHQAGIGNNSYQQWLRSAYEPTVERAQESIEFGTEKIPKPVVHIKETGDVDQEGRSRALGARRAGANRMPVWLAFRVYK